MSMNLKLLATLLMGVSLIAFNSASAAEEEKDAMKSEKSMESPAKEEMNKSSESNAEEKHEYQMISADEIKQWQKDKAEFALIDVRSEKDFKKGHIEGAANIPLKEVTKESMAKIAASTDTKVIFYCGSETCPLSAKAAKKAAQLGYNNIYKYKGGIEEWQKMGNPTSGS